VQSRKAAGKLSTEALGSLVAGFFVYYTRVFDWRTSAVSVRTGAPRDRSSWVEGLSERIAIEDPFEDERDLCAVLGSKRDHLPGQVRILDEIVRARELLTTGLGEARSMEAVVALFNKLVSHRS
jgi:DNA polymerase sigma